MEKKLNDLEYHDLLTNLPNRKIFFIVLKEVICQLKKENKAGALYLIDIDNFKRINGILNYSTGDKVLNKVSLEIKNIISGEKEVFRFGEDELLILQKNVKNLEEVEEFSKVLLKKLNNNILMEDKNVYLFVSIGSTIFPNKEDEVEDVLKRVDIAMCKAKELGKGRYEFYD
ncbi:GGDEF domain-containing protein [Clostridium sp. MSJ-11]|uniref:GGDEF domain-containing protein n=1 Tax=Clostridium mobile TaxID=2841512 RepID=A0ABS6ED87_9CLOT|nr:GGDEF domain-containing protein [Clostridium mobile]MBU5482998.1 GGDEF domain-containing protein [Clostridium mobile]